MARPATEAVLLTAWAQFLGCSAVIAVAGFRLAHYGDVIAVKTGLGGTWIGVVLVATVTSLPELVTGVSSVALADAPDIAVGDVLGSCVFNLALIAGLDFLYRTKPIYADASHGHILSAGFSVILIGLVVINLLPGNHATLRIGHVGAYTPIITIVYIVAIRAIYVQERQRTLHPEQRDKYPDRSLREAAIGYVIASAAVVAAGITMPFAAVRLADAMNWGQSFVGTLLVAGATSLPEAASTIGAVKIRAIDLAIGNLFGSNLFNVLILAIDDLVYIKGPLLTQTSPAHALSAVSAIIMTGIAIVGLHYRPVTRVFRLVGWTSWALVTLYVLNSLLLFLHEP
jgi:cation:H+ antiporter